MKEKNILLHIINDNNDKIIGKPLVLAVPRIGDEIRLGGEGAERYYKVILVVWIYDELESPFERVNIGVDPIKLS